MSRPDSSVRSINDLLHLRAGGEASIALWDGYSYRVSDVEQLAPESIDYFLANPTFRERFDPGECQLPTARQWASWRQVIVILVGFSTVLLGFGLLAGMRNAELLFPLSLGLGIGGIFCVVYGLSRIRRHQLSEPRLVEIAEGIVFVETKKARTEFPLASCYWYVGQAQDDPCMDIQQFRGQVVVLVPPDSMEVACGLQDKSRKALVDSLMIAGSVDLQRESTGKNGLPNLSVNTSLARPIQIWRPNGLLLFAVAIASIVLIPFCAWTGYRFGEYLGGQFAGPMGAEAGAAMGAFILGWMGPVFLLTSVPGIIPPWERLRVVGSIIKLAGVLVIPYAFKWAPSPSIGALVAVVVLSVNSFAAWLFVRRLTPSRSTMGFDEPTD